MCRSQWNTRPNLKIDITNNNYFNLYVIFIQQHLYYLYKADFYIYFNGGALAREARQRSIYMIAVFSSLLYEVNI